MTTKNERGEDDLTKNYRNILEWNQLSVEVGFIITYEVFKI